MEFRQYEEARNMAVKALRRDDALMPAYLLIADSWEAQRNTEKAWAAYRECLKADGAFWPCRWRLGVSKQQNGLYKEAQQQLSRIQNQGNLPKKFRPRLKKRLEALDTALALKQNPLSYDLINVGPGVNSADDEYWPALTADASCIYFTRKVTRKQRFGNRTLALAFEDIYNSCQTDTGWARAQPADGNLNSDANEGAIALTADGALMILTICSNEMGMGSCDLYMSTKTKAGWSKPRNLGRPLNTANKETQPSLSYDGKVLYFSSNRPGGSGEMDLWKVAFNRNGPQGRPENLGAQINTAGDDRSPFIHPDNKTLYFSSNGRPGLGQGDLYYVRIDGNGDFGTPQNMGYPINNHDEQIALSVTADGSTAYLATRADSLKSFGGVDIYSFALPREVKPDPVIYLKGKVLDKKLMTTLAAEVKILDLNSREVIRNVETDADDGRFLFTLPAGADYLLHVISPDHLFFSDHLDLRDQPAYKPYEKDVLLARLEEGAEMTLRNVFFATDSFRLKTRSFPELLTLVDLLKRNSELYIEIGGHTDDVGTDSYNRKLSEKRARSVFEFLVSHGIDRERLDYKGYGSRQPIAPNNSPENRARNRRTTIRVLPGT